VCWIIITAPLLEFCSTVKSVFSAPWMKWKPTWHATSAVQRI